MLALVASIHVLNTARDQRGEDVDGRDKPDHDEVGSHPPSSLQPRIDLIADAVADLGIRGAAREDQLQRQALHFDEGQLAHAQQLPGLAFGFAKTIRQG